MNTRKSNNGVKYLFFLFAFILAACHYDPAATTPASYSLKLVKTFGGSGNDVALAIARSSDGGYVLTGHTGSGDGDVSGLHGGEDIWVVKINSSGTLDWQKTFGGSANDWGFSIIQTSDGGYAIAGHTTSTGGDVSGNHGGWDVWVLKLSSAGNLEWQKSLGGSGNDMAYSVIQTSDGGYAIAGSTTSTNGDVSGKHGSADAWVVHLNSSGSIEWQECLGGTDGDQLATSIIQTSDGGYAVAGRTSSTDLDASGNHGGYDAWVVKLNSLGITERHKCLGGSGADAASFIIRTSDGGYAVVTNSSSTDGDVTGNHGGGDGWIVKLDSSLNIKWQKCIGGTDDEALYSIIQSSDDGYIVGGRTKSMDKDVSGNHGGYDMWVVALGASGNINWQKCIGGTGDEYATSMIQTPEGYALAGYTSSSDGQVSGNHGGLDFWLVTLSK